VPADGNVSFEGDVLADGNGCVAFSIGTSASRLLQRKQNRWRCSSSVKGWLHDGQMIEGAELMVSQAFYLLAISTA